MQNTASISSPDNFHTKTFDPNPSKSSNFYLFLQFLYRVDWRFARAKLGKTFELPSTVRKPAASQVAHRHAKRFGPRTWFDADESRGGKQTMQTQTNP
jgi:hypothetical protein